MVQKQQVAGYYSPPSTQKKDEVPNNQQSTINNQQSTIKVKRYKLSLKYQKQRERTA